MKTARANCSCLKDDDTACYEAMPATHVFYSDKAFYLSWVIVAQTYDVQASLHSDSDTRHHWVNTDLYPA